MTFTKWLPIASVLCLLASSASARLIDERNDIADDRLNAYAFTGGTIHVDADTSLEGTLLVREGRVVAVNEDAAVPAGYVEVPVNGLHLYPGFVDLDQHYGLGDAPKPAPFSFTDAEKLMPETEGAYAANDAIKSHYRASDHFNVDGERAKELRELGFAAVLTYQHDGIARGTGSLVLLGDDTHEAMLGADAATLYSFNKGSSAQGYPISIMGSVALLRQTYLDASWYAAQSPKPFTDLSLDGWIDSQSGPQIFRVTGWQDIERAKRIADEFEVDYIYRAGGNEYQRLAVVEGQSLIVPLSFPEAPSVDDPYDARNVSLAEMKHWELAPSNPAMLVDAGASVAITARDAEKGFFDNLRKAIERGLSKQDALRALTETPATMLGASDHLGSLKSGRLANIVVVDGELFDEDARVLDTYVSGVRYRVADQHQDYAGDYVLSVGNVSYDFAIEGKPGKPEGKITLAAADDEAGDGEEEAEPETVKATLGFDGDLISVSYSMDDAGPVRLSGWKSEDAWQGRGTLANGDWTQWSLTPKPDQVVESTEEGDDSSKDEDSEDETFGSVTYPFAAYGSSELPQAETLLIRNVTVWTNEDDGIVEGADVLVADGKIAAIGNALSAGDARVIDGSGKHLTAGIIDEHAHIALSAVNDIAVNSGMVRMRDAIDSEDVNIYRNLAGGVTAAQLLHGSSNPVGGQSALVKMRWGKTPDEMLIEDADGFIKFALGENVKRSWNANSIRYPQTRMGVEQIYRDTFTRAEAYEQAWADYNALSRRQKERTSPPRRDLVLDTMAEIINGERFISCHSYVQSEINMLMHVAEDHDFRVNTFTHILEGYKVADKMAEHGAGGSTFSDWWNYKWEVIYAIPYNVALMTEAGVVSAINSDSQEMSRRLNQEAAKAVKYGGMSEQEAWKLVTLNPAKLLHLDDRMGSVAEGKDADLVLWNENPLSISARSEITLVDGVAYFDAERDAELRQAMQAERARLVAKAKAGGSGGKSGGAGRKPSKVFECDSLTGYEYLNAAMTGGHQ